MYIPFLETNLETAEFTNPKFNNTINSKINTKRRIINPSNEELELHKKYLKSNLSKNYYK